MQLWRTTCNTDWKGRPLHSLKLVGESDSRDWLIELMNQDIAQWQAVDVASDQAEWDEDDDMKTYCPRPTQWENDDRCEMELEKDKDLRQFSEGFDGNWTTTCYHILD